MPRINSAKFEEFSKTLAKLIELAPETGIGREALFTALGSVSREYGRTSQGVMFSPTHETSIDLTLHHVRDCYMQGFEDVEPHSDELSALIGKQKR